MDANRHHIVMFGDSIDSVVPAIARLSRLAAHSPLVKSFLDQAYESIRDILYESRQDMRNELGESDTLLDLATWSTSHVEAEMAVFLPLACAAQLGTYLVDFLLEKEAPIAIQPANETLLGARIGMLSAAAVACSYSLSNLISISHQVLAVAVRLGIAIDKRATAIAGKFGFSSVTVFKDLEGILRTLEQFNKSQTIPDLMRPFICQRSASSLTISGPKPVLDSLLDNLSRQNYTSQTCRDGMATFHAPDLPSLDIEYIVGNFIPDDGDEKSRFRMRTLLSPCSGIPYVAKSQRSLFGAVVSDLVDKPALWEKVGQQVRDRVHTQSALFLAVGSSEVGSSMYHGLRAQGCNVSQYPYGQPDDTPRSIEQEITEDIAIVGYSSRLPSSETSDEFWNILENGRDVHGKKMPSSRCAGFGVDPPMGCFYDNLDLFDCQLFNMSPREAAQTDPGQRLLLMVTYEALQVAGYSPGTTASTHRRRVGTFFGQTTDDWREFNVSNDIDMFYVPGTIRAFGPGRLNYYFKWDGPSYSFDTACSSSSVAVQMACASLHSRECDVAVAGGLNTLTGPSMFAGLSQGRFLSTTGSCKTFDSKADGYCRADGVGVVVLKRLDRALQDKDNICGIIKAAVTNHSARAISITQPHTDTQARLFHKALSVANLGPSDISYVEMHGTGTPVGDTSELTSVLSVFGKKRNLENPLYIGAAKANVGHGEAAAGITSIIKALLMFRHSKVPPHVGIKAQPNSLLRTLESANIRVPLSTVQFANPPTGESRRRIMVNNFSAAGGNTCLLLDEGLSPSHEQTKDPRSSHIVVVSAQSFTALKSNTERLLAYLKSRPGEETIPTESRAIVLPDIAYTTTARRMHHPLRKSFVVANKGELLSALEQSLMNWTEPKRRSNPPSVALLFTGQGADIMGVGKQLLATCSVFRASMEECGELAQSCGYPSFLGLIRNPEEVSMPTPIQIHLATVALELSMARLLRSYGFKPAVVCGHSLGEYAALCFSGAITTAAMIYLVGLRANLVMKLCSSGTHLMLAVRSSVTSTEETISKLDLRLTRIACINSPTDTVVAGPDHEIKRLETVLRDLHIKCLRLKAPYAFHTAQMDPVLKPLSDAAKTIPFARPTIPVASTLLGRVITEAEDLTSDYFAQQCRHPVRMSAALADVKARGLVNESTIWIECGPHPLCLPMVASMPSLKASRERCLPCSRRGTDDWRNLADILATSFEVGIQVNWAEYHHEYRDGLRLAQVPTYAFDLKRYWHSPTSPGSVTISNSSRIAIAKQIPAETFRPTLSSAILHRVERDEIDSLGISGRVDFNSDLHRDTLLRTMAQGHVVYGHRLVPTSVYTEMALSAAFFRYQRVEKRSMLPADYDFKIADLVISQPLIVLEGVPGKVQCIRVSTRSTEESRTIHIEISSRLGDTEHDRVLLHASCRVEIVPTADENHLRAAGSDVLRRREAFLYEAKAGGTSVLQRPSIYRLFRSIVSYHEHYFGMQDIIVHNDRPEAVSTFQFRQSDEDALCLYSPYKSDSIAQLAGFVMNVLFPTSPDKAYISNGWDSLVLMEPLLENVVYLAHAKVDQAISGTISFTVSIVHPDGKIVAICQGLKFKELERKTLILLLENAKRGTGRHQSAPSTALNSRVENGIVRPLHQEQVERETEFRALSRPEQVPEPWQSVSPASSTVVVAKEDAESHDGRRADTSILSLIMSTMASETGHNNIAWDDDTSFAELGVDSMISMAIIHQIHKETGYDLPSTIFHEYPTLAELRSYLTTNVTTRNTASPGSNEGFALSYGHKKMPDEDLEPHMQLQRNTTPASNVLSSLVERHLNPAISRGKNMQQPHGERLFSTLRSVLCSEMGVTEEGLDEDVSLQELGLDSMLTFSVISRLREELDWEPPSTFFLEHNTLRLVKRVLNTGLNENPEGEEPRSTWEPSPRQPYGLTPATSSDSLDELKTAEIRSIPTTHDTYLGEIHSRGTFLSGKSGEGVRPLFLVPDGTGSGLAYIFVAKALKALRTASEQDIPVLYALDSPFLSQPEEFLRRCVSVPQLAAIYLREVRRIQPHGPYRLGGWSIGGIHAFEMARQLKEAGQSVELLCLIDSPCPTVLSPCPTEVIFEGIGLSVSSVPVPLQQHVNANLASLKQYQAPYHCDRPIAKTCLTVWAGQALKQEEARPSFHELLSPSEKAKNWFLYRRQDFGPCGWDKLTGAQMRVHVIESATHFDIVKGDAAHLLATVIASALQS